MNERISDKDLSNLSVNRNDVILEPPAQAERACRNLLNWLIAEREYSGSSDLLLDGAKKQVSELQAKIDSLMFEYCPDEMTDAQRKRWANSQAPASDAEQKAFEDAVEGCK